jgi:mannosyltransferase OCH1-like enzyme
MRQVDSFSSRNNLLVSRSTPDQRVSIYVVTLLESGGGVYFDADAFVEKTIRPIPPKDEGQDREEHQIEWPTFSHGKLTS